MRIRSTVLLGVLAACGNQSPGARSDGGGGAGGGGGGPGDSAMPQTDAPEDLGEVRFIAMGDTGEGSPAQYQVAEAIRTTCAAHGCDFVLLLGDNLYDAGATSVTDELWQMEFEQPYANVDLPFYPVMGNHDYGGELLGQDYGGVGNEFDRAPIAIAYSDHSTKWRLPATHYTRKLGPLGLIFLDTNSIMWDSNANGNQETWWPTAMAEVASSPWKVLAGHHPFRSNGQHGNAGSYEGIDGVSIPIPVAEINGSRVKEFFEDRVCGHVDLYLSGHEHSRQWLNESARCGGTELVVSGAGSKVTPYQNRGNQVRYHDNSKAGLLYVVVTATTLTGTFIDADGTVAFEHTLTK